MNTVLRKTHWVGQRAPELEGAIRWINSSPLRLEELRGKVLLLHFFDYTHLSALRLIPYVRAWYERYRDLGFLPIGIHTPEFDFSGEIFNIHQAVRRLHIAYPVVVDQDYAIWSAFQNTLWPRILLVDSEGVVRLDQTETEGYGELEREIRGLLGLGEADSPEPVGYLREEDRPDTRCYPHTPELRTGYSGGAFLHSITRDAEGSYYDKGPYREGFLNLHGRFRVERTRVVHTRRTRQFSDYVAVKFQGTEAHAILSPLREPFLVQVTLDDAPVPEPLRGTDLEEDELGRTVVRVSQGRLYELVSGRIFGHYLLKLYTNSDSFALYGFSFGGCAVESNGR